MSLFKFQTKQGGVVLRLARAEDIPGLIALNKECFPSMAEENVVWNKGQLQNHQRVFPEGQIVAESEGTLVGAVSSLIVRLETDDYRPHTYAGITDGGYFHNHNPLGDSLYGADVYVHPNARGLKLGHHLYEARRLLCRKLNLRRIIAGGRISGYHEHAEDMTPQQYVAAVVQGELFDQVLSFQLREGFVVRGLLRNYITDPLSRNCATFVEWQNPEYRPTALSEQRKVRVAAVQYQVRRISSFEEFADQVEYFVETAADYHADFVLFPEFFSMQLLSQQALKRLSPRDGMDELAKLEGRFMELMKELAARFGLMIVAGTHPMRRGNALYNICPLIFPDGRVVLQPKLHITPSERTFWGITGGNELGVISTPKAKVGLLICYDSEFPEAARHLADQGAEILFVPYCTDDRQGFARVHYCCQARAIENQMYVVTAGIIGNLPSVPAMDIHYAQAAVFCPSDFEFARDGVRAIADTNVETLLVTDLDINDLYRCRAAGSVTPRLDRRADLFEFRAHLKNDLGELDPDEMRPLEPMGYDED